MSGNGAALAIICGATLLAAWVDTRFPRLTPGSFTAVGLHMLCSLFVIQIGMKALGSVPHEPVPILAALFGAALPATIYLILSAFWVLKLLHGLVGRTVR